MTVIPPQSALLAAAKSGDGKAFEALVEQHRAMLWSVCLRVTGNTYDAEDALQDTLLAAWRNLEKFRGDAGFGTWVYRIASNAALAIVRSRRATDIEVPENLAVERDFAEQLAAADVIQQALKAIPEEFRVALVLRELCDFTYAQIAEHQGIGVPTVKTRISRARRALEAAASRGAL
ncbi:RNA polymerase sigma factor [Arthrobacter sp. MDT2-16]